MSTPAVIHCVSCLSRIEGARPIGILLMEEKNTGLFHLLPDNGYERGIETVCGLPDDMSHSIGTRGLELSDDVLTHQWLLGAEACRKCFAHVW